MKDAFGFIGALLGICVLIVGLGWLIEGNQFLLFQFFAPKGEQVRRNTFEQSKAYNQGMIQELRQEEITYVNADEAHKTALRSLILHDYADYDAAKLPPDLYAFMQQLEHDAGLNP